VLGRVCQAIFRAMRRASGGEKRSCRHVGNAPQLYILQYDRLFLDRTDRHMTEAVDQPEGDEADRREAVEH
jgi:hypothetical protein